MFPITDKPTTETKENIISEKMCRVSSLLFHGRNEVPALTVPFPSLFKEIVTF